MLIGLHGRKQSGKDTVYERIEHLLGNASRVGAPVERVAFADLMYECAAASLGVTEDELRLWKANPDYRVQVRRGHHSTASAAWSSVTVRQFIQNYGQVHRRLFGESFWVDRLDLSHDRKVLVVTDVRMANEAQAILDAGGSVVRVLGPPEVEAAADDHVTERPLPGWMVDWTLDNAVRDDNFATLDERVLELFLALLRGAPRRD